jgi:hypothetical protein
MTSIRVIPRYVNHLWYPILVKMGGGHRIVELQGKEVNAWNDRVREQWLQDTKGYPRGWRI